MKTAVLAGSTGLIGGYLLELLLASDRYSRVISLTRTARPLEHPKYSNIITDFSKPGDALGGMTVDDVFCCLGTTMAKAGSKEKFILVDHTYPALLGKAARERGATQYLLVSALGADKNSRIFYNRVKGELEEEIKNLSFPATHIARPSLLLGPRDETRRGEEAAKVMYRVLGFLIPAKFKAIEGRTVAHAMLAFAAQDQRGFFVHESADMQRYKK